MNILLDYFFPITAITPTPAASTAFLKQVLAVVKPNAVDAVEDTITLCTSKSAVDAFTTTNDEVDELFDAGMSRVYVLATNSLPDLGDILEGHESDFFTVLISSDFNDAEIGHFDSIAAVKATKKIQDIAFEAITAGVAGNAITIAYVDDGTAGAETIGVSGSAITVHMEDGASTAQQIADAISGDTGAAALVSLVVDDGDEADVQSAVGATNLEDGVDLVDGVLDGLDVGAFKGVVGISSTDDTKNAARAATENYCGFHSYGPNGSKNMFYAFGKLLSNALNWTNQQYITMPLAGDVTTLGAATALFDDKISFVISDSEFGKRLALFAQGGKAIIAPYIKRNLEIDLQSAALSYISGNQPQYTRVQAALLEDELKKIVQSYIDRQWIENGTVEVKLEQENFVASGYINIAEPSAMWRIFGEIRQTL